MVTESRMASSGPNEGSTSPSAIPFWNFPTEKAENVLDLTVTLHKNSKGQTGLMILPRTRTMFWYKHTFLHAGSKSFFSCSFEIRKTQGYAIIHCSIVKQINTTVLDSSRGPFGLKVVLYTKAHSPVAVPTE